VTRTGSANDTHETVAVFGDACFRSAMALDHAGLLNGMRRGWDAAMGLRWVRATEDELVAELDVDERHRQRFMVRSPDGDAHGAADAEGALLATGRVRLLVLERGETPASAKSERMSDEEKKS